MSKHVLPGALVALSLLASFPAQAFSGSSSATIDGIKLELIDLAPDDGITPALQFTSTVWDGYLAAHDIEDFEVPGAWNRTRQYGGTGIVMNENVVKATTHFETSPLGTHYYWNGYAVRDATFTLTPNTGLRFSAHAGLHVDAEYAEVDVASYFTRLTLTQPGDPLDKTSTIERSFYLHENGDRDFDLQFYVASGARAATGSLYLSAWSSLQGVSTVPEPASYGMLLAGAALLGAVGRWRRRA